jgi:hypothetical protein
MKWLEQVLDPERDNAWQITRVAWAITLIITWIPRVGWLREAYTSEGVVLSVGRVPVTKWIVFTPSTAYGIWALILVCLLIVAHGRWVRPALVVYFVCSWALLFTEGLHIRAYDRLQGWQTLVLLFAPCATGSKNTSSPLARYAMLIVYCGIYGSTGLYKALDEPRWQDGSAMAYHLIDDDFGGLPLGVWLSSYEIPCLVMSWWTLIFETTFPILCWFRRTNPWCLLAGAGLHLGIFMLMNVYMFSWIALCVYPILLHPTAFRWVKARLLALLRTAQKRFARPELPAAT